MKRRGAIRAEFMARQSIANRDLTLTPVAVKHPLTLPDYSTKGPKVGHRVYVDKVKPVGMRGNFGFRISDRGADNERIINRREWEIFATRPGIRKFLSDIARSALLPAIRNPKSAMGSGVHGSWSTPQESFPHLSAAIVIIEGFAIDTRGDHHA